MNESGRVEAFSDGVFAVAITLLVLNIKVPTGTTPVWQQILTVDGASYAAYALTFLIIGIMWANHHTVFGFVAQVDRALLFFNLLLLMVVVALPWAAGLVAEYLDHPAQARTAMAVYSGFMVAHSITFSLLWWWLTRTGHCFDARVDTAAARALRMRFAVGLVVYPVLLGLSFVSALLALALHGALALYYAFNQLPVPVRPTGPEQVEGRAEGPAGEDGAL